MQSALTWRPPSLAWVAGRGAIKPRSAGQLYLRRREIHSAILIAFLHQEIDITETWLPSMMTATPQEGFALAITLSRRGVKYTQPDMETLKALRPEYSHSADALTAASQVIAINFQTVAAAKKYWRG